MRRWRGKLGSMKVLTWNLFHGRAKPRGGPRPLRRVRGRHRGLAVGRRAAPGGPALVAAPAGRALARVDADGADVAATSCSAAARRGAAVAGPDQLGGRRVQRDPRARRAVAEHRRVLLRRRPEKRWMHAVRLDDGTWVANLHAEKQPLSARGRAEGRGGLRGLVGGRPGGPCSAATSTCAASRRSRAWSAWRRAGSTTCSRAGCARGAVEVPDPRPLSDHRPVLVELLD